MVINYCDSISSLNNYIDLRFRDCLLYIANHILNNVYDLKRIQGNINDLSTDDQYAVKQKAQNDYDKACAASDFEMTQKDMNKSISKWGEIFGSDFPTYG